MSSVFTSPPPASPDADLNTPTQNAGIFDVNRVLEELRGAGTSGGGDARVDGATLRDFADGRQAAGGHGVKRLVQVGWLAAAAEAVPEIGPVALEDEELTVGLFQAAQEPEEIPFTRS